jgi:hypothetical protein
MQQKGKLTVQLNDVRERIGGLSKRTYTVSYKPIGVKSNSNIIQLQYSDKAARPSSGPAAGRWSAGPDGTAINM